MAFDGVMLHYVKEEIKNLAIDARVSQVHQPNRDELVLALRTKNGNKKLLISSRANSPRVCFTEQAPENPATPPMLCMLLRKRLGGAKLVDVRQPSLERILFLDFIATNELGDRVKLSLCIEIMGKYSNIILIDSEQNIVDALKRVDFTMSTQRLVLPNIKYELPPQQDKLCILDCESRDIADRVVKTPSEMKLSKALLSAMQGVSPIVTRELEYKVGVESNRELTVIDKLKLVDRIEKLKQYILSGECKPTMLIKSDGKPFDICFTDINQYGEMAEKRHFDSFSEMLDSFYFERDRVERMKVKAQDLLRLCSNISDKLNRKIAVQQKELADSKNRDELRKCGDLLQANIYRMVRGQSFIEVDDYYNNNEKIKIKLSPTLSPSQNVQKYYKDYRRAKTREEMLTVQIEKAKQELEYISTVQESLTRAENERELSEIRRELSEQGYVRSQSRDNRKQIKLLPPKEYKSSDGFTILIGRNNKQNDKLTLKTAGNYDMWLHTKNIPGSHVIIISDRREITETAILEAASLAAYNSKARESSQVPVDYTYVRNVSKPNGSKPGMVIYVKNKTVYVTPKADITK
ncbi:MAG: NFACT family protein [Ruminococcus sp.]|nr:NFACT family protein [Ruminococcus sp.]MBQ9673731.1 NFACT family protein [Ruminococcus sp.]